MRYYGSSEEHGPVMRFQGYAIYAAHFVVVVYVLSMIASTVMVAFANLGAFRVFNWLEFDSERVLHGEVWRMLTYGLVNPLPPGWGGVSFAFDMLWIVWFGREVEKMFGRRKFLVLFAGVYLISPFVLTALGFIWPNTMAGERGAFAVFIAFATIYPNVALFFFGILAKWAALILLGIYTLAALAYHDWTGMIALWASTGFAHGFVRYEQGVLALPKIRFPRRRPKLRVLADPDSSKSTGTQSAKEDSMAEVDALLDKIARSGISSLTPKERAKLERAREGLMKKPSPRR